LGGVAGWLSDDDVLDGTSPGRVLLVLILLACVLVVVVAARANAAMLVVGCGAAIAFLAAWGFGAFSVERDDGLGTGFFLLLGVPAIVVLAVTMVAALVTIARNRSAQLGKDLAGCAPDP
jgi:hypothetical protein